MTRYRVTLAALLIAAAVLAAGCLSGTVQQAWSGDTAAQKGLSYPASAPAPNIAREAAAGSAGSTGGVDTKIIKTGQVSLEVQQVPAAIDRIKDIAVANGGYLSSSNIDTSTRDRKTGYAMIRIPAASFDTVMAAIGPVGKVLSSSEQRSDVTEEYVDLTAQKESYQNQIANYNRLMTRADKVEDILKIQVELDRAQTELNRIEGRLRYLNNRIDLATISVNLREPEPVGGETGFSIITSINEGIAGFFGMISALIIIVLSLLPLIILLGIVYVVYRWYQKRKGAGGTPPVK